jgi:alpha-L-arabinofuranosidase
MCRHFFLRSCLGAVACLVVAMAVCARAAEPNPPASKPAVAQVSIDASKAKEPISPYIYGQFIEHLGRCIYGGIWAEMLEDRKFHFPVPADTEIWTLTREQARVLAASPWKVIETGADNRSPVQMVKQDAFVGDHSPQLSAPGNWTAVGIYQE